MIRSARPSQSESPVREIIRWAKPEKTNSHSGNESAFQISWHRTADFAERAFAVTPVCSRGDRSLQNYANRIRRRANRESAAPDNGRADSFPALGGVDELFPNGGSLSKLHSKIAVAPDNLSLGRYAARSARYRQRGKVTSSAQAE